MRLAAQRLSFFHRQPTEKLMSCGCGSVEKQPPPGMASALQGYRRMAVAITVSLAAVALTFGAWIIWKSETQQSHASSRSSGQSGFESRTSRTLQKDKEKPSAASQLVDMMQGKKYPRPTREQLEAYIEQEGRSARSLIAAFMISPEGKPWLDEAAERYPQDARVSAMMLHVSGNRNVLSEEWIQRMKQNDPENSLGWCYAGLACFKAGDKDKVMTALEGAASRGRPHVYHEEIVQEATKAYKSAGFDSLQAEVFGMAHAPLGGLSTLNELISLMKSDPEGFTSSAAEDTLALAGSLREPRGRSYLIEHLVSHSMERSIANSMDWYEEVPGTNMMAVELQEKSRQESRRISALAKEYNGLLPSLSDTEMKQYLRRVKVEGELKAMEWVVQTRGAGS